MASTYSTNLKIELQATGENPGTWGTITNTNLGTALEQAIVGYGNPSYASDANLTLTYTNTNAAQTARSLVLNVTSAVSLTATRELVVPTIQKQYIVQNNTTGAQSITVKTSAGTGITVPNGRKAHLYVDGTNVIQMFDFVDINGGTIDGVTLGTSSAVTEAQIDNINLNGNTISSTDTNGNLILAPNGTGDVQVNADTLRVGDSNVDATITTNGTGDLILNTNSGSSSGSIRIYDGANGDIEVTASGTGSFNVAPNMLVGTTTDFTSTGAAGGVAVSGYGIYPYTLYSGPSPSGSVNTTNSEPLVIASSASFDGSSSISYHGIGSYPTVSATGAGGTNGTFVQGFATWPQVPSSGASARLSVGGIIARAIRASSSDASSNASNSMTGIFGVAGIEGTVASGASAIGISGVSSSVYSGSGTTTALSGVTSRLEASSVSTDQNTTITTASLFIATGTKLGMASGPTTSITNLYGINLTGPGVLATATVTNYYAFFAAAPTVTGTLTNRWGVYIADASSPNYFAGSVQVGAGTAAAPTLTTIADTNTGVFFPAADVVGVSTGGTERLRVDAAGNLGLGVTPSAWSGGFKATQYPGGSVASYASGTNLQIEVGNAYYQSSLGTYAYYNTGTAPTLYRQISGEHRWLTAPSGTAGNAITFTQAMTLDASGNLGVGTASPGAKLDVDGGIRAAVGSATLAAIGAGDLTINASNAAGQIAFRTAGSERARIDASGNLGVGTTSPGVKLQVVGTISSQFAADGSNASGVRLIPATTGEQAVRFITADGNPRAAITGADAGFGPGVMRFYVNNSSAVLTEHMRLDASGNLGVGTTTPTSKFYVAGASVAAGDVSLAVDNTTATGFTGLSFREGATSRAQIWAGNGSYASYGGAGSLNYNAQSGPHVWYANYTERARITSGGALYVGTTTSLSATDYRLQVTNDTSCALFRSTGSAAWPVSSWNSATTGDNLLIGLFTESGAGVQRGSIDYNRTGGLTRYNTTSDYRAKDIIGPLANTGATIDALKVYEGKMKDATQSRPMLIAHEAQEYAPYAVSGVKDEVNEDGTPKFQQMDVSSLVPLLLAEIQSLRARVADLENK